jgi:DNA replication and repair protein RecF
VSISHEEDFFIVQGQFVKNDVEENIICSFHRLKQKVLKRNGKEYQRLSDHVGKFPVVMISPADSTLISEGSEERRKFMNKIISQYDSGYLDSVLNYNKALQQRNRLLRDFGQSQNFDPEMLSVWDSQLVKYGKKAYHERDLLIRDLSPVFQEYYSMVSNGREEVKLDYRSHLSQGDYSEILLNSINRDRTLEYTTSGIHKDDLLFEMNGFPVKSLGSQGQQKSYLVALKLAKFDYIKRQAGLSPVLLLDDIFDKFDTDRVAQIIRLVGNHRFGQIFITDTHQERLQNILNSLETDFRLFRIGESGIEEVVKNGNRGGD